MAKHRFRSERFAARSPLGPTLSLGGHRHRSTNGGTNGASSPPEVGEWFGEFIPPETLVEWAQRHGRRGFLTAAELLNAKGDHLSDSARLLVKRAPNPKEVLDQLFANLGTGSFVGPISSHLEGQLATLKKWAQDEEPRIRSWAEAGIAYAEKGVKRQRLLEEEGNF